MMQILEPNLVLASVFDIDFTKLQEQGIKGLLVDIDNTLVPWEESLMGEDFIDWAKQAKNKGLKLCIVSNALQPRAQSFADLLEIPAVGRALKPLNRAFVQGLELLSLSRDEVAVVGDQLFTDILGGNRLGLFTILINPLSQEEFALTKLVRKIENKMLQRMVKRGRLNDGQLRIRQGRR